MSNNNNWMVIYGHAWRLDEDGTDRTASVPMSSENI
jgi:hypothetical protein